MVLLYSMVEIEALVVQRTSSSVVASSKMSLPSANKQQFRHKSKPLTQNVDVYSQVFDKSSYHKSSNSGLYMATDGDSGEKSSSLPFWLDPGTRGGAIFLSLVLFLLPLIGYSVVTSVFGIDEVEAGKWIGVGFTAIATFLWVSTYIFRVATKDMTYVSGREKKRCGRCNFLIVDVLTISFLPFQCLIHGRLNN
jgi:hypothetical protein